MRMATLDLSAEVRSKVRFCQEATRALNNIPLIVGNDSDVAVKTLEVTPNS
jgi:hypothetical protein